MHQKARMLVGKYTSMSDKKGNEQAILDEAFKMYENIVQLAAEVSLRWLIMNTESERV